MGERGEEQGSTEDNDLLYCPLPTVPLLLDYFTSQRAVISSPESPLPSGFILTHLNGSRWLLDCTATQIALSTTEHYTDAMTSNDSRDIDDIGKILGHLLDDESNPRDIVAKCLTPNRKAFRADFSPRSVGLQGMKPLVKFHAGAPVMTGGSGVVFKVTHAEIASLYYALKIPRPSLFDGKANVRDLGAEYSRITTEYLKHAPLSHRNIARVFTFNDFSIKSSTGIPIPLRAVLMEWVEGATPLADYLLSKTVDHLQVIRMLTDCFWAMDHLHSNRLIHWDMKSDNFLVSGNGVVKLMDIGNARRTDDPERDLLAYSSRWNLPRILKPTAGPTESTTFSSRLFPVELRSLDWDNPWIDIWMLAREINRLFGSVDTLDEDDRAADLHLNWLGSDRSVKNIKDLRREFLVRIFPHDNEDAKFARAFIDLILQRILAQNSLNDPGYYRSAYDVASDLEKFEPEFGGAQTITELRAVPQRILRLAQSGNAPYSNRVGRLYNSELMTNLRRHLQLGSLFHVYPGASHRRSEHSAGVFDTVVRFIRALYADRTNPFWRLAIRPVDINALLVAALLHDTGHIAYGHFLEEMGGLFKGREHEDYLALILDPLPSHVDTRGIRFKGTSVLSAARYRDALRPLLGLDWAGIESETDLFLQRVSGILHPMESAIDLGDAPHLVRDTSDVLKEQILHSIMDSAIDADKLDYLLRDSHHCGVKYAEGIDLDRFYQSLTTISDFSFFNQRRDGSKRHGPNNDPKTPRACVAVTRKGLLPVESILLARYQMFSSVYWHKTARSETAMLQLAVMEYVGAVPAKAEDRLEELIQKFRTVGDEEALKWLRESIEGDTEIKRELRAILTDACDAVLGAREKLYRTVFELHYEPEDIVLREERKSSKAVYEALLSMTRGREKAENPVEYLKSARQMRNDIAQRIGSELQGEVKLWDGDILIDIPPASKDQVENVFVHTEDGPKPIQELSAIADAVRNTFRYWARPIRVFLAPAGLKRAEDAGYSRSALREVCARVFQKIAQESDKQMQLPFSSEKM